MWGPTRLEEERLGGGPQTRRIKNDSSIGSRGHCGEDLPAALAFYRDALGLDVRASEDVASQRVRAHFVPVGESSLELLEATAPDSPIADTLETRGPGCITSRCASTTSMPRSPGSWPGVCA